MRYEDASDQAATPSTLSALNDADVILAGNYGPATGNAITGTGTVSGIAGADMVAAGASITAIQGAGGTDTSFSGGKLSVAGQYGVLTIDAEGNYSYVRNQGSPNGVSDVFSYTLSGADGASDLATLTINIGKTPLVVQANAVQVVPGPDGVVTLPDGVELSDIHVVGRNLVIELPDGSQMIIVDGAVFVPQLVLGTVEVPSTNLAALLIDSEPTPAAGPPQSSGGNFAVPVAPLDPGAPLGDLIPPTVLSYTPPTFDELANAVEEDEEITVVIVTRDNPAGAVNATDSVDEAGLPARLAGEPDGTGEEAAAGANGDTSEITTGTIVIDAPDGIDSITINGELVTGVDQTIAGAFGTLRITSIVGGQIGYSYTLNDNTIGDSTSDLFTVVVTDDDGDAATATLTVGIIDDEPIARDDTDAVAEGATGTDGNVLTALGTTNSGADSPGADGFDGETNNAIDGVTGVHAGASGSFTAVAQNGTGTVVVGTFGRLEIHNDGSYTYTLLDGTDGGGNDVFTYQITDGDGDVDTATLTIAVPDQNDPPTAVGDTIAVSEEGLPGANDDTTGNPDTTNDAVVIGNIGASDPDGDPLTITLGVPNPNPNFTSQGDIVHWLVSPDGHTLTGFTGGGEVPVHPVITVVIQNNGTYTVTLLDQLDHPDATSEDAVDFTIPVSVDDGTAPPVATTIVVSIEDDSPEAKPAVNEGSPPQVSGLVDEDDLVPEGNNDNAVGDDDPGNADGDFDGTTTGGNAGSLAVLFNVGADEPMKFGLKQDTTNLQALKSGGKDVLYDVNGAGTVLTAYADVNGDGLIDGGDTTVFTLSVNVDGSWSFDLEDQLDHPAGNDENDITIDFSSILSATDFDNDPAAVPSNSFVVTVDDDVPVLNEGSYAVGTVHEDALANADADGNSEGVGQTVTATILAASLAGLVSDGADDPVAIGLNALIDGVATGLTHDGDSIVWNYVSETEVQGVVGSHVVFTITAGPGDDYTFTLLDKIDHSPLDAGDLDTETLDLGGVFVAVDTDGDDVVLDGSISIDIENDVPVMNEGSYAVGTVHEDALANADADGNSEGVGQTVTATILAASLAGLVSDGADDPVAIGLNALIDGVATGLTHDGDSIVWNYVSETEVQGVVGSHVVFTITAGPGDDYTFTLLDKIDHDDDDPGDLTTGEGDAFFETLSLAGVFTATDTDGDTVIIDAGASVNIENDVPVLGQIDDGTANNNPLAAHSFGDLNFTVGADDPAKVTAITLTTTATSGNKAIVTSFDSATGVLTGYQSADNAGPYDPVNDTVVVFTLTVNPAGGTSGTWDFDLFTPLDTTTTPVDIGGSSSFGAGPTPDGQILTDGADPPATPTPLSVISGYNTTGSFNFAAWHGGGLTSAMLSAQDVNGSTAGWGVDDNNFNTDNVQGEELLFFDFGAQALSNPDGAGGYEPAAGVTLPDISFATFDFIGYDSGAPGNAGDDIAYVVHYTDGSVDFGFIPDVNIDGAEWTFTADPGKFIADIQFYSGANPDGTDQDLAPGKVELVRVGVETTSINKDLTFDVTLRDSDGDPVSDAFTINVASTNSPSILSVAATSGLAESSFETTGLIYSNDSQEQQLQKTAANTNTVVLAAAVAAAGMAVEASASDDVGANTNEAVSPDSQPVAADEALGSGSEEAALSALGGETSEALVEESGEASSGSTSSDEQAAGSNSLTADNDLSADSQPAQLLEGTEAPANVNVESIVSPVVAMPSAEALIAASLKGGEGDQSNAVVGLVLVDALEGGGADGSVDALLEALPAQGLGENAALDALASQPDAAVSAWDSGHSGGLSTNANFTMEAMALHHDAVQPVANG